MGRQIDVDASLPATHALVLLLVGYHLVGGLWAWAWWDVDAWTAWLGVRPDVLRAELGGQHDGRLMTGAWWRLWTSVLLHIDALHLLLNVMALVVLGRLGEPLVGAGRWLGCFWVGGVAGSLLAFVTGVPMSDGASGGAFALMTALSVFGWRLREDLSEDDAWILGPLLGGFTAFNLVLGVFIPGVELAAHVGGCAAGAATGASWGAQPSRAWWVVVLGSMVVVTYGIG